MTRQSRLKTLAEKFSYSSKEAQEIWHVLKDAGVQRGCKKDLVIQQITTAAKSALDRKEFSHPPRYAGDIKKELQNLVKSIDRLLKSFPLTDQAKSVLQAQFQNAFEPNMYHVVIGKAGLEPIQIFVQGLLASIQEAAVLQSDRLKPHPTQVSLPFEVLSLLSPEVRKVIEDKNRQKPNTSLGFPHHGAPQNAPQEIFGLSLCAIYSEVTGEPPKHHYDAIEQKATGHFYNFVCAAIRPTKLLDSNKSAITLVKKICTTFSSPPKRRRSSV